MMCRQVRCAYWVAVMPLGDLLRYAKMSCQLLVHTFEATTKYGPSQLGRQGPPLSQTARQIQGSVTIHKLAPASPYLSLER